MRPHWTRAVAAGVVATSVTTFVIVVAASLGAPVLEAGSLLTLFLAADTPVGWTFHFLTGIAVAVVYAALFSTHLPGSPAVRGITFGALLWSVAQGMWFLQPQSAPLGEVVRLAIWSLPAHLTYGSLVGWLCGVHSRRLPTSIRAHA